MHGTLPTILPLHLFLHLTFQLGCTLGETAGSEEPGLTQHVNVLALPVSVWSHEESPTIHRNLGGCFHSQIQDKQSPAGRILSFVRLEESASAVAANYAIVNFSS